MAQDDFVDLYTILEVPPETDEAALKKRISEKYLEAQQNLDHRNAKKRLVFQQMYEIYLPQARHLLLDAGHRAEYDRYLKAFLSGKSVAEIEPTSAAAPARAGGAALSGDDDSFKDMDGKAADPKKLAAQREQLWDKWKTGLETGFMAAPTPVAAPQSSALDNVPSVNLHAANAGAANDALPTVSVTPPTVAVPTAGASGTMYHPATAAAAPAAASRQARRSWSTGGSNSEEETEKRRQEEQERERDRRLHEVAVQKAEKARKTFMIGGGLAFLVVVGMLYMFMLMDILSNFLGNLLPGGMGFALSNFAGPVLVLVGAYFFGKFVGQYGYDSTLAANRPAAALLHSANRPKL